MKIFISYRRDDSRHITARIQEKLEQTFGENNVFKDVTDIRFGEDFRRAIFEAVINADVVLVIIGQNWLSISDENSNRRLDNPADFVRIEVENALTGGKAIVIPVLVDNAKMPKPDELPISMRELAFKQAIAIRDDRDFNHDLNQLIVDLKSSTQTTMLGKKVVLTNSEPQTRIKINKSLYGLVLSVVVGVILLLIGIFYLYNKQSKIENSTEVLVQLSKTPLNITETVLIQLTFTVTPSATDEGLFVAVTKDVSEEKLLAIQGINSNDEWISYGEIINNVEMMLVPKGCFMMGNENGHFNEKPVHEQCFDKPFWIDKTEVTRASYYQCVEAKACNEIRDSDYSNRDTQPINRVTWFEAQAYCDWRSARLPTETEWEYAARGPNNLVYPWGNSFIGNNTITSDVKCKISQDR